MNSIYIGGELIRKFADIFWPIKYDGPLGLKIGSQKNFSCPTIFKTSTGGGLLLRKKIMKNFKARKFHVMCTI